MSKKQSKSSQEQVEQQVTQTKQQEKSQQQPNISKVSEIKEEKNSKFANKQNDEITSKTITQSSPNKQIIKKQAQPTGKLLVDSGLIGAYDFVLRQMCKNGLPKGNIFEYAAQEVLRFEKTKMKKGTQNISSVSLKSSSPQKSLLKKDKQETIKEQSEVSKLHIDDDEQASSHIFQLDNRGKEKEKVKVKQIEPLEELKKQEGKSNDKVSTDQQELKQPVGNKSSFKSPPPAAAKVK